jgi:hypothetical protein
MTDTPTVLGLGGGVAAVGVNTTVRIIQNATEIDRFDIDAPVQWLKVAPDGRSVIVGRSVFVSAKYDRRHWYWRKGAGHSLMATVTGSQNHFNCGFAVANGEVITLVAQHDGAQNGILSGFADDGSARFTADLGYRSSCLPHKFVQLPGGRLTLIGRINGDPTFTAVTVSIDRLINDPEAVLQAIWEREPFYDHSWHLSVGPCGPDAAVAARDPDGQEKDEDYYEEADDTYGFTGVYMRNLDTGAMVEQYPYKGDVGRIAATTDLIAVEVAGGIDIIQRGSGAVRQIRRAAAALDIYALEAAWIEENGHIQIAPISELLRHSS